MKYKWLAFLNEEEDKPKIKKAKEMGLIIKPLNDVAMFIYGSKEDMLKLHDLDEKVLEKIVSQPMSTLVKVKDALAHPENYGKNVKLIVGNALSHEIERMFGEDIIDKKINDKNNIEYILPYDGRFEHFVKRFNRKFEILDSECRKFKDEELSESQYEYLLRNARHGIELGDIYDMDYHVAELIDNAYERLNLPHESDWFIDPSILKDDEKMKQLYSTVRKEIIDKFNDETIDDLELDSDKLNTLKEKLSIRAIYDSEK